MWKFILVLSLSGLLDLSSAQLVQFGQCDQNIELVGNFQLSDFTGRWFGLRRTGNPILNADCSTLDISVTGSDITFTNEAVNQNFREDFTGNATLQQGTAKFTINVPISDNPVDFWILATDYSNWALGYSCSNVGANQRNINVWQLGRNVGSQTQMQLVLMNHTLNSRLSITLDDLTQIEHSEQACYVLPDISPNEPVILSGQCDQNIKVLENFDVARFTGVWHNIASYFTTNQVGSCQRAEYVLSGNVVNLENSEVVNQMLRVITGSAVVASTDGSARLKVTIQPVPGVSVERELLVLASDYDNYAVSYSCENISSNQKRVSAWIVSRSRTLSAAAQEQVNAVIASYLDLNERFFSPIDQSNEACFYFPEPAPDRPVVFRGQCNMNIPAMPNFIAGEYLGRWHNIESYPSIWQDGSCINAVYSLGDGVVDVLNSQVVNQTLGVMKGFAVVSSTDGSAKLDVTFPVADTNLTVTLSYWVLDTDYKTYSLVYSCQNLNADEMQVWSWKLSRTRQLTADAQAKINNVINSINVLDGRYYWPTDQSAAGCFFFPEPQPGVPVVFPGQCDTTIPVVPNFDMTLFQGTWFEYQAYPKMQQTGQCIAHQYTTNTANSLNLVSSSVVDQFLNNTLGALSFSTSSTNGALTLTVQTSEGAISFPFWILGVDYQDYALAYSCVNIDEYYQGIYSWKLTRTRGVLSTAANTAINNIISNNVVLEQRYYEDIDQSAEACFYWPDLPPGEAVILPGQCDETIPVVQNFNVSAYSGLWRLIESYPADPQIGTCNEATYTLQGSSITIVNSQVVNQTLLTITGDAFPDLEDGSGRLIVTFPTSRFLHDYWILDTDYDSYALVYSCVNMNSEQQRVWSWKLSRTNELSSTAQANINRVVDSVKVLNNRFYEKVDRSEEACFYYPEPNPGSSVIFRGQCDESIPVVTNFDAVRYMNLWHDVQSYPSGFQNGDCNNAFYTLNDGEVDVFNTQVIDQTLKSMRGVARLASTANVAKLIVSFPIAGTNQTTNSDYWVLATDYDNYALVYSCVNLEDNQRRVQSWKLSRTKSLSINANNAINAVMENIPVLREQYFITRDQSPDACFYFPEPLPGVPVVFPGQCDDNLRAKSNFNLAAFQGTWHEIEAYPKEQKPGECINHLYTLSTGNNFDLQTSSVLDLTRNVTISTVGLTSTDGTGRLTINTPSAYGPIPFWILDTDYTNYALAYSCINILADFRAVYSWKLSRTRELPIPAIVSMNFTIGTIDVLDHQYFEPIDQSDEACFYLPDLGPNDPVIFNGQCDENIPVVQNFDVVRYTGLWRLIESYPANPQTGTCNDATYTLQGSTVQVFNTQVINETLNTITGSAVLASNDSSAKLLVTFPSSTVPSDYWVLDTDYDSYALVYNCVNLNSEQRRVWSWKLSRTNELSSTAQANINRVVDSINVLDDRFYQKVDRSDEACFYYPEPNPETAVTFRGQCDENIPVVTNFDAVRYMNLWFNTDSYPTGFQSGACNNAFYTLNGNEVDVFNTEVVNQTLKTINGVARFASAPNVAKLIVTFPRAGTNETSNADYWVLATDYDNYALVYTCVNLEDNRRRVQSWKLSRTRSLSTNANNAINAVMANIPVLREQYFITRDQSPDACFYLPEPQPGVPVVIPGQCDDSIQAISNFNLAAFQGIWHEIEAYPKEQKPGECINHLYTLSTGNNFDLQTTSVLDLTRNVTISTVGLTSTDGSGRLTINTPSAYGPIPFWILDTDYIDYALAYSCINIGTEFRTVYSWKLSRSRQLSSAARVAIDNTINPINVLENRFYEPIDQSDEACFYLPDLGPNDPVIFNGQCDENIPVVQNFDVVRYTGLWRLIESYPANPQTGTCNDATYTLQGSTVQVFNTQVINETLNTITGSAVLASNDSSAKLLVTFPSSSVPSDYWVLDTDYDSYALVYTCVNLNSEQRRVWSWKLSRTNELSSTAQANISRVVDSINVLDDRFYQKVDRSDEACFYFPTPDGKPVSFRGQCDENIPVVNNFDLQRYMGKWYDIESYPQAFQDGSCSTAVYNLTADGVAVFNTHVVSQELFSIDAIAVPANPNDSAAKFIVTFPIAGTNLTTDSPYWVLATDYDSFALVYSCTNDGDRRKVGSWKLSRERSLAPNDAAAINRVIDTIPVLQQQYYSARGHSDDDCFYYPNNNGGPVILSGQCITEQNVAQNFSATEFLGTWYEHARFPSQLQDGECTTTTFWNGAGATNTLTLTQTIIVNERLVTVTGEVIPDPAGRGILTAKLSGSGVTVEKVLYVLSTDYTDHALIMSCTDLDNNMKQIFSWQLGRSRQGISNESRDIIADIVDSNVDLFRGYYEETDQTPNGCFHYPVFPDTPSVIELVGNCDTSIKGKANFNAGNYLGRWFEIARYPASFQNGQCARAEYIAGEDAVRVVNSEVDDKKLDIMIGSAVVSSADGSGVLNVSFAFDNGVVNFAEYYILETDYINFALVYSCRNVGNDKRHVFSWKLSRTRSLSNEANAIMDRAIADTQGLLQEYYMPTRQDEDACFYIPEINRDQAPQFRGQCGNITGIPNFNAQLYVGWWHEIERYPSDIDVGVCISSDFRATEDGFQIIDTNVFNLTAQVNVSTVVVDANGMIKKTFSDGSSIDIWVLATDYENYSLLFSCENVNDEYMRVWSAKHSRTRSLSSAAQSVMDEVIQNNRVLLPNFFIPVDQTDEACFHYPEQTGTRVVLPGQCDDDIPVVQSFDAVQYSGTWFQMERYAQPYENGTCVGARYTPNLNTGVISVLNWQVLGDVLDTVEGTANVTSTDNSARLRVSLPVRGTNDPNPPMVERDLWVLTTDYISYSLVYSCVNINEFQRSVGAWKLSRTRTLSEAGNTAINNYMATRQELHQPFFTQVEQNDDCLGPNSASLFRASIIILLICALIQILAYPF